MWRSPRWFSVCSSRHLNYTYSIYSHKYIILYFDGIPSKMPWLQINCHLVYNGSQWVGESCETIIDVRLKSHKRASSSYLRWTLDPSVCCKVNGSKQLSFGILPPGKPVTLKCFTGRSVCFLVDKSKIKTQTASYHVWTESITCDFWGHQKGKADFNVMFTCHFFCRWNCCQWIRREFGCPWSRPSLSV